MKIRNADHEEKIELQMTPMIDVVFQLLIFFVMTFDPLPQEGDFNIRMPLPSDAAPPSEIDETLVLNLRLRANDDGTLAGVAIGDRSFGADNDAFARLHAHIRGLVDDSRGPGTADEQEVEIDADYDLHYDYIIRSITALSGYIENDQRYNLIEKIKFAKPRE